MPKSLIQVFVQKKLKTVQFSPWQEVVGALHWLSLGFLFLIKTRYIELMVQISREAER